MQQIIIFSGTKVKSRMWWKRCQWCVLIFFSWQELIHERLTGSNLISFSWSTKGRIPIWISSTVNLIMNFVCSSAVHVAQCVSTFPDKNRFELLLSLAFILCQMTQFLFVVAKPLRELFFPQKDQMNEWSCTTGSLAITNTSPCKHLSSQMHSGSGTQVEFTWKSIFMPRKGFQIRVHVNVLCQQLTFFKKIPVSSRKPLCLSSQTKTAKNSSLPEHQCSISNPDLHSLQISKVGHHEIHFACNSHSVSFPDVCPANSFSPLSCSGVGKTQIGVENCKCISTRELEVFSCKLTCTHFKLFFATWISEYSFLLVNYQIAASNHTHTRPTFYRSCVQVRICKRIISWIWFHTPNRENVPSFTSRYIVTWHQNSVSFCAEQESRFDSSAIHTQDTHYKLARERQTVQPQPDLHVYLPKTNEWHT